jgi:hypothetical protein
VQEVELLLSVAVGLYCSHSKGTKKASKTHLVGHMCCFRGFYVHLACPLVPLYPCVSLVRLLLLLLLQEWQPVH